jgi:acyl-ACP thioesterase
MQIREDRFTVKAFDCRPDGCIRLNALMQYLQEAAARHAAELGFGFADLDRLSCFWVLVNLRIDVSAVPGWRDDMMIRTWPSGYTRLMASREFVGRTVEGAELFRASSEWMILDRESGRPRNLHRMDLGLPESGTRAIEADGRRLQSVDGYVTAWTLRVPFSALDFNGHVNNTEYVRWALDGLHSALDICRHCARRR